MRTFFLNIIEQSDGTVRIDCDFGDESKATVAENYRAVKTQDLILAVLNSPDCLGSGSGDSPLEARQAAMIEVDIKKAAE